MDDRNTFRTHADIMDAADLGDAMEEGREPDPEEAVAQASLSSREALLMERMRAYPDVLDGRAVRGRPVVDLSEGRQVGTVADLLLDTAGERVVGLTLSLPYAFAGQKFLPFNRIRAVGEDAVTIDGEEALEPPLSRQAARGAVAVRSLEGKRVITDGGDVVGGADDVVFHRPDGRIVAYVVDARGGLGPRDYLLWTRGLTIGEDVMVIPNDAVALRVEDRGGVRATWDNWLTRRKGGNTLDTERDPTNAARDAAADDRLDSEFQYVIGHITQRDVVVDGQVVVPANTQVTAAEATAALASGALEDLAFAVGMGDPSKTDVHGMPDDVEGSWQPLANNITPEPEGDMPATGTMLGTDQPTGTAGRMDPEDTDTTRDPGPVV